MKRILSMVLVLVMVFGMIPMASAANCADGAHVWVEDTANSKAATCTEAGVAAKKCSVDGCEATDSTPVEAKGHAVPENAWETVAPTCSEPGYRTGICVVCGQPDVEIGDPATGEHTYGTDGKCTVCGAVKESAAAPVFAATAADLEIIVGKSAKVTLSYTKDGVAVTDANPTSVTFSSADSKVASVNSATGEVTGVAKGTTTVTAVITGLNEEDITVTVTVKVTDDAVIVCENKETDKSSITVVPSLQIDGKTVKDAKFNFKVVGEATAAVSTDSTFLTLTKDEAEIVKVTISVKSFTGSDGKAGDPDLVESKVVYVSFYEDVDMTLTVKSGTSSFKFGESGVFSAVKFDKTNMTKPTGYSVLSLLNYGNSADWYRIYLNQIDPTTKVGSISYPGSVSLNAFDKNITNTYSLLNLDGLQFTCLEKGEFELMYTLEDKDHQLTIQEGIITLVVDTAGVDLSYTTGFGKALTLDEKDFNTLWNKSDNTGKLDYVVFNVSSLLGEMRVDDTKDAKKLSAKDEFYYNYESSDAKYGYDLDEVVYIPYTKATKSYEERISFTCYGEKSGEELNGVMLITVGETMSFTDVKDTDYFYKAVEWAVNKGVTAGTSKNTFSPNATCTREQVVTFLWRAAGEPEPSGTTKMKFTDVDKDAYYYDAVMWAVEEGITTGTSATTFSPKATVTRGQVVTFLWRAMGEKQVSASNPFSDVKKTDYFYEAVLWAVKNDVTTGLSATSFGPNSGCTRGQIVTFLYRAYQAAE